MIDRNYIIEKRRAKQAREKQVKIQLIIITLTVSFMAFILFMMISSKFNAHAAEVYKVDKIYTSYEIEDGDNLTSICSEYRKFGYLNHNDFYHEVCSINQISSSDIIKIGQNIIIPQLVTNYKEI